MYTKNFNFMKENPIQFCNCKECGHLSRNCQLKNRRSSSNGFTKGDGKQNGKYRKIRSFFNVESIMNSYENTKCSKNDKRLMHWYVDSDACNHMMHQGDNVYNLTLKEKR